jgi:hypothetical protein
MFTRILVFIILTAVAIAILKYTEPIVRTFGKNDLAEKYLGMGGTYNMWKILAVIFIVVGFLYLIGSISFGF